MTQPLPWKENADRLSSAWLDGRDGGSVAGDGADELPEDDAAAQGYLADLLLVDALLANMSESAEAALEARIRRVMEGIDPPARTGRPRVRLLRWSSVAAVAACLLIAVTLMWMQLARNSLANEVLAAVNEASAEATDRIYAIRRVLPSTVERQRPQGRLYLRGRSGFVMTCDRVVLGRDADQFWLVGPNQQVTLSDDFHWIDARATHDTLGLRFLQELSLESRHIPLMQLASVAELMRHDYDVTLSRELLGTRSVDLLIGHRRSARSELPATIQLWADSDSRIIQRAELAWGQDNAIILDLLPDEPVPERWYHYEAHCRGEPKIRRVSTTE
jgi:hypothetical protein